MWVKNCLSVMAIAECLDIRRLEIRQSLHNGFKRPVPPGYPREALRETAIESLADMPRRHASYDGVGFDVATGNRACRQHGAISDRHTGKYDHPVSDPDVMTDHDAIGPPVLKKDAIALRYLGVVFGTIGKAMQRRTIEQMVRWSESHLCRDS